MGDVPITENDVVRIIGHSRYPDTPGSPAAVATIVSGLRALPGHVFWADDISLVASNHIDCRQIRTAAQVTDTYLLALAAAHGGKLATFDRRLLAKAATKGKAALHLIES